MKVTWQELRDVCLLAGCVVSRSRGDHLVMVRPGMLRPVVIKMDNDLGEDIVRSNMRTLGLDRDEFQKLFEQVKRRRRSKKRKPKPAHN